jgi:preprotein translocase subunit SecY
MKGATHPTREGGGTIGTSNDLKSRIWFTLGALVLIRLGTLIPVPGIDPVQLWHFFAQQRGGVLGVFDMFVGGALGRMSIFALGLVPYFTAFVMVRLLAAASAPLRALERQGQKGRKRLYQYVRLGTLLLATFQAFGFAVALESSGAGVVPQPGIWFKLTTISTLTAGTVFLMWLAERIDHRGLGPGAFLILACGIVVNMPAAIAYEVSLHATGALDPGFSVFLLVLGVGVVTAGVALARARRHIPFRYQRRRPGLGGDARLSIDLIPSGPAAPVVAGAFVLYLMVLATLTGGAIGDATLEPLPAHGWIMSVKAVTLVLIALFVFVFLFLLAPPAFDPADLAARLKQRGAFLPGLRPGAPTADHLHRASRRLALIAAVLVAFLCLLPDLLVGRYQVPLYLGGTSLLIVTFTTVAVMRQLRAGAWSGPPPWGGGGSGGAPAVLIPGWEWQDDGKAAGYRPGEERRPKEIAEAE